MFEYRLDQSAGNAPASEWRQYRHAKQGSFVPGALTALESKTGHPNESIIYKRA